MTPPPLRKLLRLLAKIGSVVNHWLRRTDSYSRVQNRDERAVGHEQTTEAWQTVVDKYKIPDPFPRRSRS